MHEKFRVIAARISLIAGAPLSFSIALSLVLVWAVSGPFFHFSNTWQLIVNTGTTIVTFLMVFLIQNAQNRDAVAVQLKLDELIRSVQGARLGMINIDQLSDDDLTRLRAQFQSLGDEDGGCDELEADISTEEKLKVNVRTRFDSTGKLASQEVDREETRQRTATVRTDDDDHDEAAKPDKSGGPAVRRSGDPAIRRLVRIRLRRGGPLQACLSHRAAMKTVSAATSRPRPPRGVIQPAARSAS